MTYHQFRDEFEQVIVATEAGREGNETVIFSWTRHVVASIHLLSTECIGYMLTEESNKYSNWSPEVLTECNHVLIERILLDQRVV
jgi:hypothetical protein